MKNIFNLMAILTLFLITSSCIKDSTDDSNQSNKKIEQLAIAYTPIPINFTILKSIQASNEANQLRSPDYSALFEISKVNRVMENLQISLTYPVGCGDSKFEVIWNGLTTQTSSKIIVIYLRRKSECIGWVDPAMQTIQGINTSQVLSNNPISQILSINLTELLGDAILGQNVTVLLCNASKKTNTNNSDILASVN